mmetsp:Transcript_43799/g.132654  ORF Transcript_43799/g.132654 Transcript_43799/m.132654 type:complete len:300 (+) Transcript_43799:394-1293(+)
MARFTPPWSIRFWETSSLAVSAWMRSRLACVSRSILSLSGLPTAMASTLARHFATSFNRPRPSNAHALRNHALWSSSSRRTAMSAASRASFQLPILIAACAKFFSTARCSSPRALPSSGCVSGARTGYSALWACLQLESASSTLPLFHSITPSCLHLAASFMASFSSSMVATTPPFSRISLSFLSFSSDNALVFLNSQARYRSSMPLSPAESAVRRKSHNVSLLSSVSKCDSNGMPSSMAFCAASIMKTSTTLYLSIGATRRFVSGLHCSSMPPTLSRLLFKSWTLPNCSNHWFFLVFQ